MKRLYVEIETQDNGDNPIVHISTEGENHEVSMLFAFAGIEVAKKADLTLEQLLSFLTGFYGTRYTIEWWNRNHTLEM